MITDNKQDELIFDFLEGNLSPDEEEAFRILRDESELLGREVRLWQNTYLKEPLPSVEALQKRLYIPQDRYRANISTRLSIILIAMLMSMVVPGERVWHYPSVSLGAHIRNPSALERNTSSTDAALPAETAVCSDDSGIAIRHVTARKQPIVREPQPLITGNYFNLPDQKPKTELFKPWPIGLRNTINEEVLIKKSGGVSKKTKLSRRDLRLIRKKRWKENEIRNATKLLKGHEPYVVPLNSNNF